MIISKKNKIILITPPKTGTHSITKYLSVAGIESDNPTIFPNYPIYHLTLSEICKVYNISVESLIEYKIIQCVRNPYDRMVSAWLHQISILNNKMLFSDLLIKIFETKHLLPTNTDEFYKSFYGSIEHKRTSFRKGNWGGMRFYFEQNWFNDTNSNIKYFKLEEISNSTKDLSDFLNIDTNEFPHINKNIDRKQELYYRYVYTDIDKALVNSMYINDIKMFNYEF